MVKPNLLIADSFGPHSASSIQRTLALKQSCLAIIPSACSPILQPLHRGIKQKFKVRIITNSCHFRHYGSNRYIFTHFFQDLIDYEAKVDSYKNGNPHAKIVRWVDKAFKTLKQNQVGSLVFMKKTYNGFVAIVFPCFIF